jgi:hypothetical protein
MESFLGSSIVNVLLSVFANVLTTVLFSVGRKGYEVIQGKEPLKVHLDTNLTPILQKAVAAVARSSQFNDPIQTQKLQKFLVSPEVEALVRQIYASKLVSSEVSDSEYPKSIREEFIALFALNIDSSSQTLDDLAHEIFEAIFASCEKALEVAINRGVLAAHEAKSAIRYQMLYDELTTIEKNLKFLTGQQQINIQEILEFEKKYRQQISNRHRYIIPPSFDTSQKIKIDQLYVCPGFIRMPSSREEEPEMLNIDNFRSVIYRSVLLGNPGGGKSTFTDKLCNDLATRYSDKLLAGRQVTPIHVVLRDYGSEKLKNNCSILQFIQTTASSKYQLLPTLLSTFEYLLLNGRVVVIFDGLDELIDTSYRKEISKNVESFCSLYPSVPVLVTSREVGYKEVPLKLDEGKFEIFHLDLFNHNQVKDYVDKWFAVTASELNKEQRDQKVQAFIEESSAVPDLRSNPLMLALLCNIYRGENYIPKNRPDVYEKCSAMLFERWDRSRGIQVSLPFESGIIFAMMYLAHWIYTNETLQGGVTERQLIAQVTDYLCQRQFDDRDEAERAGCEFIEFCRGRAWVFTDTGTTKDGESLYQFTHRTFLEYFTAKHLVRISPSLENLQEILLPKISNREWDVVAQLAFRIQDKQTDGAGDKLLTALIKKSDETEGSEKWNLIFFATRCLEFMVPSPSVRREITKACIKFCIEWGIDRIKNKQLSSEEYHDFDNDPGELLCKLLNSAIENRKTIAESWKELIIEQINGQDDNKSFIAYEIGINHEIILDSNHLSETIARKEFIKFWGDISENIFETCFDRIKILSSKYYQVWLDCIDKGKISILSFANSYTINHMFENTRYTVFPKIFRWSVAETIFYRTFLLTESLKHEDKLKLNLNELGQILASYSIDSLTLITELKLNVFPMLLDQIIINRNISTNYQKIKQLQLSANAIFAAFFILAVFLEIKSEDLKDIIEMIKRKHLPLLDSFQSTFLSRFAQVETNKIQAELKQSSLAPEHQVFVWKWVRKEINLVAKSKHQGLKLP